MVGSNDVKIITVKTSYNGSGFNVDGVYTELAGKEFLAVEDDYSQWVIIYKDSGYVYNFFIPVEHVESFKDIDAVEKEVPVETFKIISLKEVLGQDIKGIQL